MFWHMSETRKSATLDIPTKLIFNLKNMIKHFLKSLQFRILVITVVAIIPFILFSVFHAEQDRERSIANLKNEALELVNFTLIEESQTIDGTRQLLVSLANLPDEYLTDPVRCKKYLTILLSKYQRYMNLGIVDDKGILFASAQPVENRIDYSKNEFFIEAMQQKGFSVGEYAVDPISLKRIINLGYPALDEKQNVKAVVFVSLGVSYLEEYEKDLEKMFQKERIFMKIDSEGDVLTSNVKSDELTKSVITPSFLNRILEKETGILENGSFNNQKFLFVFASTRSNLFQKTLRLVVGVNKEKFFSDINKRLYSNLLMTAFFFVLILAGVLILSDNYILKIVRKLIKATQEMVNGNLQIRSRVNYDSGELGQLAMTFDRMAESLEEQNKAREKSEGFLRESEERYRLLFENSLDAILLTEPGGNIYSANPAACKMFQKTEEEICRLGRAGLVDISDPRLTTLLEERKRTGKAMGELTMLRKDGTIFPVELSSSIFYDSHGQPKTTMIIRDITERKQAEDALRQSRTLLKTVLSNAPITIFATDDQGLFTLSDGKGLERIGLNPGENIGVSAFDLYGKFPFITESGNVITGLDLLKRILAGESLNVFSELGEIYFDNRIGPLRNASGEIIGIVGVATDITERKKADEKLIRHENELKLLSSELINAHENEKKTLALELHDEIGQALTAMKINLSSVMKNIPNLEGSPNGERLIETDDLLETILSRVHEISLDLRPVMLDVLGFLSTIKSYGKQFSKRTGIEVHIEIKNNAKPDTGQEIHLFRIVQESLTNTAKHAEAQNINIQMETKNNWFCLVIEDDGKGFDIAESGKSLGSSSGIGLIGINERVISMQGEINITSSLQKGTKIEIKVPLNGQKK